MDLSAVADELRSRFDSKNKAREIGLSSSRSAIRACGNAIRALHRYEWDNAEKLIGEAESHLGEARAVLADHPDVLYAGFFHDAEKEFVEARVTHALVTDAAFPSMDDLGATPQAYSKGMAEAIGELRRHILDLMRRNDLKRCEELLGKMDEMYYVLVSMDYPDGITFGLRRLTDVARSIIERTRGDYTTSSIQASLRTALEAHSATLEGRSP
jgi:translin